MLKKFSIGRRNRVARPSSKAERGILKDVGIGTVAISALFYLALGSPFQEEGNKAAYPMSSEQRNPINASNSSKTLTLKFNLENCSDKKINEMIEYIDNQNCESSFSVHHP